MLSKIIKREPGWSGPAKWRHYRQNVYTPTSISGLSACKTTVYGGEVRTIHDGVAALELITEQDTSTSRS